MAKIAHIGRLAALETTSLPRWPSGPSDSFFSDTDSSSDFFSPSNTSFTSPPPLSPSFPSHSSRPLSSTVSPNLFPPAATSSCDVDSSSPPSSPPPPPLPISSPPTSSSSRRASFSFLPSSGAPTASSRLPHNVTPSPRPLSLLLQSTPPTDSSSSSSANRPFSLPSSSASPAAPSDLAETPQRPPPLVQAARDGRLDEAQLLLSRGADPDGHDPAGWTPIMWACFGDHVDLVALLLDGGANLDARNAFGNSALHYASVYSRCGRTVDLLLAAMGDAVSVGVDGHRARGWTPLHAAAFHGNRVAACKLLAAGASKDARDGAGKRPCDVARTETLRTLLQP